MKKQGTKVGLKAKSPSAPKPKNVKADSQSSRYASRLLWLGTEWAQAAPVWIEPPHLWCGVVGDSGTGKSPGSDVLLRDVLPEMEHRMSGDFPDRLRHWKADNQAHKAKMEAWEGDVRMAQKNGSPPPLPPAQDVPAEPQAPRLRQNDVTIEKVAEILALAAPKGVLIVRDEVAGWVRGMNNYHDAGRAFWIEAYGGREHRVERKNRPEPIVVPRLAVGVTGGTQPDKLAELFREADDGLLARFAWFWPDPLPGFRIGSVTPGKDWAITALDRLRMLDLAAGSDGEASPVLVRLAAGAVPLLEKFAQQALERQQSAGGLMRSALGKARGLALRLSVVLEFLWWGGREGYAPPPGEISEAALVGAVTLVNDYLLPMAERVYGDAAASTEDRNAATLARWIIRTKPAEVHVRQLQREVRLPGLTKADAIHAAARVLVEAGWLIAPDVGFGKDRKVAYRINSRIFDVPT